VPQCAEVIGRAILDAEAEAVTGRLASCVMGYNVHG
jgi:hypothetical protein